MSNSIPYISVIISVLNGEKTIERAILSVIRQTGSHVELIIKDGGSKDRTIEMLNKHKKDIVHFESAYDNGIYDAWNRALSKCSGDWICFIGSDDFFISPTVLSDYVAFLKQLPTHCKIVYGINQIINTKGERLYTVGRPWSELKASFLQTMSLPHPGLMHHRSLFDEIGLFKSDYKIAGDYEFLLRALKYREPAFFPKIICATPIGGISTLPKNNVICLVEIRKAKIQNGMGSVSLLWIIQLVNAIMRLVIWYLIGEKRSRHFFDAIRQIRGLDPFWTRAV